MWSYPKRQTPDPAAPKNGPSADDMEEMEKKRATDKVKAEAATAKKDAEIKADEAKKELKKSVKEGKAAAAK
jgi:hypothetical protein